MAKLADYFDKQDEAGVKYTVLDVPYSQRKDVRAAAEGLGQPKLVEFNKDAKEWRLVGDLVPKGVKAAQVDAAFGQWKTPEAAAAVAAEREAFSQRAEVKKSVEKDKPEIDASRLYYPVADEKGKRENWTAALAALKDKGTEVRYNGSVGAFVHMKGPTDGLEAFQTPEAKAAWDARGRETESRSEVRREDAGSSIEAQAYEAKGELLMAASVKGFALPSKTAHPVEHAASMALISGKRDEAGKPITDPDFEKELSAAYQVTEVEKKRLEAKLYGIQISVVEKDAAVKKGGELTEDETKALRTEFNNKSSEARREAAGFTGLDKQEFGQLVGVKSGFFALRSEMVDRGLLQTKEQAQSIKQEQAVEKPVEKAAEKSAEPRSKPQSKSMAAGLAAALAGQSQGR